MTVLTDEGWTADDLYSCSIRELKELAAGTGVSIPYGATKADVVALLTGRYVHVVPSADDICAQMLQEAAQLRSWVRGVPRDSRACLSHEWIRWLQAHDVPAINARANYYD